MPKSKLRKNHKEAKAKRQKEILLNKAMEQKQFRAFLEGLQREQKEKSDENNILPELTKNNEND